MQFRVRNNDGIAMAVVAQVGASCVVDARLDRMIADGLISFESLQAVLMPTAPFQSGFHFARIKEIDTDYGAGFEPAGASFLVGPDYDADFEQRISIDALPQVDWMQLRELCELKARQARQAAAERIHYFFRLHSDLCACIAGFVVTF